MQTFLPFPDFAESVATLDRSRLGKQRVETLQVMGTLLGVRLTGTFALEDTGKTREGYFNKETDLEIFPGEVDGWELLENYYTAPVAITRKVDLPWTSWIIEDVESAGWSNHPVSRMWRGYELALLSYQEATVAEWLHRGYKDTCWEKTSYLFYMTDGRRGEPEMPPWMGDVKFHLSHMSNLVRKDPEHYAQQFPGVPNNLEYIWPEEAQSGS